MTDSIPLGLENDDAMCHVSATSEVAIGNKLGFDATKKLPGEGFKRPWPPLIKMEDAVKGKIVRWCGQ